MKKLLLAVPFLFGVGYLAASPYLSAYQLQQAVDNADGGKVVAMMDIESVKHHLTEDLHTLIEDSFASDDKTFNFNEDIAKRYMSKAVDTFVTPQGVHQVIEAQARHQASKVSEAQDVSLTYLSPNRFEIQMASEQGVPIRLELHRHYLGWKIMHIHIPESYIKRIL